MTNTPACSCQDAANTADLSRALGAPTSNGSTSPAQRSSVIRLRMLGMELEVQRTKPQPCQQNPCPSIRKRLLRVAWRLVSPGLVVALHHDTVAYYAEQIVRTIGF